MRTTSFILTLIAEQASIDIGQIKDVASLSADLGLDDLDKVELMVKIEHAFGISISDDESGALDNVSELCAFVSDRVGGTAPAGAASKMITKLVDNEPLTPFQRKQLDKINELVDQTNRNTRAIEAIPKRLRDMERAHL